MTFFGRTDFRKRLSKEKFDVEVDFEVRSAVALQNSRQIDEKRNFDPKFSPIFILAAKMKRLESSETRFDKVSRRSEPCSRS